MPTTEEDEYFPPPPQLRDLLACLAIAASLNLGARLEGSSFTATDRQVNATDMLVAASSGRSV